VSAPVSYTTLELLELLEVVFLRAPLPDLADIDLLAVRDANRHVAVKIGERGVSEACGRTERVLVYKGPGTGVQIGHPGFRLEAGYGQDGV